ncbi:MAG: hypothetical protein PF795_02755 [Kiritimatiellae bacterium]|nr:hypothetical protein [Kiritimatiellia bacterium]
MTNKLEILYAKLGFREIESIPYMLRCPTYRQDLNSLLSFGGRRMLSRDELNALEASAIG